MKIDIQEIQTVLTELKVPTDLHDKIINRLEQVDEEKKLENQAAKLPKQKNEFGVILFDEAGELAGKELYAHIYAVKQGFNHASILDRISSAIKESNEQVKKKTNIITTIGQAFESLKRKFSKNYEFQPKSKQIVRVVVSSNKII